jgi:hypothetical protein
VTARRDWLVLLPREAAEFIEAAGDWGTVTLRLSAPDKAGIVVALTNEDSAFAAIPFDPRHFLNSADYHRGGHWYRVGQDVTSLEWMLSHQQATIPFEAFRSMVPRAEPPGQNQWHIALTYCADPAPLTEATTLPRWAAWLVSTDQVYPIPLDLDDGSTRMSALEGLWPMSVLSTARVLLLGAGSIGGAALESLAAYGVGHVDLVDPDKLRYHNVPRHVLDATQVGRAKVDALADQVEKAWPDCTVVPHEIDLIVEADQVRSLMTDADIVICTVDGVEPRQVASYLARRSQRPIVLACVLEDGRYAEVLRIRPLPEVGCLDCQRRRLRDGGALDLETSLDRGYGTGSRHRPMTAIGADLHLVGSLAAKVTVATVLRHGGSTDQTLVDDNLVIALRPRPGLARPFDASRTLDLRWYAAGRPCPDCPACAGA